MMSYFKSTDTNTTKLLKALCIIPFSIMMVAIWLYNLLLKTPVGHRPGLAFLRIVFWFSVCLAFTTTDPSSFFIAWGNETDRILNEYPSYVSYLFHALLILLPLSQVPALFREGEPAEPGENIGEAFGFLDQMLNQQSTRGKTEMLSKFFGGKL